MVSARDAGLTPVSKLSLNTLIHKVKTKKKSFTKLPKQNLLAIAILSDTLDRLKYLKRVQSKKMSTTEDSKTKENEKVEVAFSNDPILCELNKGFDSFFCQLKGVKNNVHR